MTNLKVPARQLESQRIYSILSLPMSTLRSAALATIENLQNRPERRGSDEYWNLGVLIHSAGAGRAEFPY